MITMRSALSTLAKLTPVRRLASHEGGVAAVEFSLILPVLLLLWIGGVEVTGALSVDRRLNNLASSIGDLVSRSKRITWAETDDIFRLAEGALFPYKHADESGTLRVSMRITAVTIEPNGDAVVAWSRAKGPSGFQAHLTGASMNSFVPAALRKPAAKESQVIMSEVLYTYTPALGYVVTGDLPLEDKMFFVPRLVAKVPLCETSANGSPCVS